MARAFRPDRPYVAMLTLVAGLGLLAIYCCLTFLPQTHWFDTNDIGLYYKTSRWTAGEGTLYGDVPSEYPLLANVLFGACRVVSDRCLPGGDRLAFSFLWMGSAWLVYLAVAHVLATRVGWQALVIWLAPGALFFALTRFDIYCAGGTLLAMLAFREARYLKGAFWIGVTIALKGYALFALPPLLIFVLNNRGWKTALQATALCVGPFLLANLLVLGFAGPDGMLSSYRFHLHRTNFGESSYDAFYYLTCFLYDTQPTVVGMLPMCLQLFCALAAAALCPRTFEELVDAVLIGVLGLMSFSAFYSPQYLLWVLPIACFSSNRLIRLQALALGWVTFLYYPVFHVVGANVVTLASAAAHGGALRLVLFRGCVIAVTALRFGMMGCALGRWWKFLTEPAVAAAAQLIRRTGLGRQLPQPTP